MIVLVSRCCWLHLVSSQGIICKFSFHLINLRTLISSLADKLIPAVWQMINVTMLMGTFSAVVQHSHRCIPLLTFFAAGLVSGVQGMLQYQVGFCFYLILSADMILVGAKRFDISWRHEHRTRCHWHTHYLWCHWHWHQSQRRLQFAGLWVRPLVSNNPWLADVCLAKLMQ